ncbi:hypothetical protein ACFLXZ_00520 [Chloroflexota bacterium]
MLDRNKIPHYIYGQIEIKGGQNMKPKLMLAGIMVIMVLLLAACSPGASVDVSNDDFMESRHISKEVKVNIGDSFRDFIF